MNVLIFAAVIWGICKLISACSRNSKQRQAERERERIRQEQARIKDEQRKHREFIAEQTRINREAFRERLALRLEQEKQAKELAKHEEMLLQVDNRLAVIEGEIAHNREIVDRIANLIKLEEAEQSKCAKNSQEWAKHEKKIVSLMNQQYNAQKKITKAKGDRRVCEQKISA